ncbi:MAG: hypothetical protein JSW49_07305 [candidate division WOR-3 bacterium]|nr:MAG: hypothetical protein JSW49_07305 [candidate division WOR-3 bacterium]
MIFLLVLGTLVFQNGDTLQFVDDGDIVDIMILDGSTGIDSLEARTVRRGKVSDDNRFFSIHEEVREGSDGISNSKVSFYDSDKTLIWEETATESRIVSYELSGVHNALLYGTTLDQHGSNPAFFVVTDSTKSVLINEGDWEQVIDVKISPNGEYLVFHVRNPYNYKMWDYIYFYDLNTSSAWDYLFPVCVSCKRARIDLNVDNDGRAEVVYKTEHRIFSKFGALEDLFFKLP